MKVSGLIEKLKQFQQDSEVFIEPEQELFLDGDSVAYGEIGDIDERKLYLYEAGYDSYPMYRNEEETLDVIKETYDGGDGQCFPEYILSDLETKEGVFIKAVV